MGVNVSSDFLGLAERFLHCRVGSLPFMYLGLPVGANPRKETTWKPLLDTLAKRLNDWHNRYIHVMVWKRIVKLQRQFLWGGKWRWRLLQEGQGIWRDIILARYGSLDPSPHLGGRPVGFRGTSSWWRDVSLLGVPLRVQYSRLFQVSQQCHSKVSEMGNWVNGEWTWDFMWRRNLFVWEVVKLAFILLESTLGVCVPSPVVSSHVLAKVWKSWAPSKVSAFSWQLLQD
ncbi:putative non-LTR retroelement reverse transcriptase, partial [Trifolium medium]|nr:putative non-LTR retroelement reverse transcriptase [Trifolium medium]